MTTSNSSSSCATISSHSLLVAASTTLPKCLIFLTAACGSLRSLPSATAYIAFSTTIMASTNTDEVFEADVNAQIRANARVRSHSRKSRGESQSKRLSSALYEHTPLLERDPHDQEDGSDNSSDHGSQRSTPDWFGARDFEGRPWWRKPSVSKIKSPGEPTA